MERVSLTNCWFVLGAPEMARENPKKRRMADSYSSDDDDFECLPPWRRRPTVSSVVSTEEYSPASSSSSSTNTTTTSETSSTSDPVSPPHPSDVASPTPVASPRPDIHFEWPDSAYELALVAAAEQGLSEGDSSADTVLREEPGGCKDVAGDEDGDLAFRP